jgi:hypothetical protein
VLPRVVGTEVGVNALVARAADRVNMDEYVGLAVITFNKTKPSLGEKILYFSRERDLCLLHG